mmetsp:Transcript_42370/g.109882  ORF Transcript_42370/g.109882 Transcript_42370/m.109882 type:complete len:225 (-) Transcript_42370:153-827(-)
MRHHRAARHAGPGAGMAAAASGAALPWGCCCPGAAAGVDSWRVPRYRREHAGTCQPRLRAWPTYPVGWHPDQPARALRGPLPAAALPRLLPGGAKRHKPLAAACRQKLAVRLRCMAVSSSDWDKVAAFSTANLNHHGILSTLDAKLRQLCGGPPSDQNWTPLTGLLTCSSLLWPPFPRSRHRGSARRRGGDQSQQRHTPRHRSAPGPWRATALAILAGAAVTVT